MTNISPINHRDKQLFMHAMFKVGELALWKKYAGSKKSCYNLNLFHATPESVNCSFLEKSRKAFLQFDFSSKHIGNLLQHLSEKFVGDNLSITDIVLRN